MLGSLHPSNLVYMLYVSQATPFYLIHLSSKADHTVYTVYKRKVKFKVTLLYMRLVALIYVFITSFGSVDL